MTTSVLYAEELRVPERLIVAPAGGVFSPVPPETVTTEGEIVAEGQTVGHVSVSGEKLLETVTWARASSLTVTS